MGPGVLCPRADTEVVAEAAAELLRGVPHPKVLDLCAGTGCLGLGVQRFCPAAEVTSLEKSPAAFAYLTRNARLPNGLHLTPVQGDLFTYWETLPEGELDLIVSNPPYLTAADGGQRSRSQPGVCAHRQPEEFGGIKIGIGAACLGEPGLHLPQRRAGQDAFVHHLPSSGSSGSTGVTAAMATSIMLSSGSNTVRCCTQIPGCRMMRVARLSDRPHHFSSS